MPLGVVGTEREHMASLCQGQLTTHPTGAVMRCRAASTVGHSAACQGRARTLLRTLLPSSITSTRKSGR